MNFNRKMLFCAFLLLLLSIPSLFCVALAADTSDSFSCTNLSSFTWENRVFDKTATVDSLWDEIAEQEEDASIAVWSADGVEKLYGPLETGDLVKVYDGSGVYVGQFTVTIRDGSSSSELPSEPPSTSVPEPPSSTQPSSSEDMTSSCLPESSKAPEESKAPDSSSSENPGNSSSDASGSSSESSSGGFNGNPVDGEDNYYYFSRETTIEILENQISDKISEGCDLKVLSKAGALRNSGYVCTGDTVEILDANGEMESRVTAIVPGDVMRCGTVTKQGCRMIYDYLVRKGTPDADLLLAADMDRNGVVDTADLLNMKKAETGVGKD